MKKKKDQTEQPEWGRNGTIERGKSEELDLEMRVLKSEIELEDGTCRGA